MDQDQMEMHLLEKIFPEGGKMIKEMHLRLKEEQKKKMRSGIFAQNF